MSLGVEFDEDSFGRNRTVNQSGVPVYTQMTQTSGGSKSKMGNWLMKHGLAKSENSAQVILIGIIIFNIIVTIIMVMILT